MVQYEGQCEARAKAGDFRGHVRKSAAPCCRREVHVRPGDVVRHEAFEKTRGENVVALALQRALRNVSGRAFDVGIEVIRQWKLPEALATCGARSKYTSCKICVRRHEAAHALG